jgi:hypothetical protein
MQLLYAQQVERTLVESNKSLKMWPWLQEDMPFHPELGEIIQANGNSIIVS